MIVLVPLALVSVQCLWDLGLSDTSVWDTQDHDSEVQNEFFLIFLFSFFLFFKFWSSPVETLLFKFSANFLNFPMDFVLIPSQSQSSLVRSSWPFSILLQTLSHLCLLCFTSDPLCLPQSAYCHTCCTFIRSRIRRYRRTRIAKKAK